MTNSDLEKRKLDLESVGQWGLKLYLESDKLPALESFVPVFHRWIRENVLDELLIDVADYRHVPDGPAVMLVGHEGHYSIDLNDGRPGLRYLLRRAQPKSARARLDLLFSRTLRAAERLENESTLEPIAFSRTQFRIETQDRLFAPNTAENAEQLETFVAPVFSEQIKDTCFSFSHWNKDARYPLALEVSV